MKFKLIKYGEFRKQSFVEHNTWAQYYEPDDINRLERLGFDKRIVCEMIAAVDWSDDYWFPIPDETEIGFFKFEHRKARIKTPSGNFFDGYVVNSGHAIGLFGDTEEWVVNIHLLDLLAEDAVDLRLDLGMDKDEPILPLKIEIVSKNIFFTIEEKC